MKFERYDLATISSFVYNRLMLNVSHWKRWNFFSRDSSNTEKKIMKRENISTEQNKTKQIVQGHREDITAICSAHLTFPTITMPRAIWCLCDVDIKKTSLKKSRNVETTMNWQHMQTIFVQSPNVDKDSVPAQGRCNTNSYLGGTFPESFSIICFSVENINFILAD